MPNARDGAIATHDITFALFSHCSGCGRRLATGMAGVLPTDTIAVAYFFCEACSTPNRSAAEHRLLVRYQRKDA